jgi:uncharacterized membrane protein YfcA
MVFLIFRAIRSIRCPLYNSYGGRCVYHSIGLILLGVIIGAFGTFVGLGGGFLLVPTLFFLYPGETPEIVTGISLAMVLMNSISGSAAYARMGRIDYRVGVLFALASIPGSVAGALTSAYVPVRLFAAIFGAALIAGAVHIMVRKNEMGAGHETAADAAPASASGRRDAPPRFALWGILGCGIGYASAVLGVGGGIFQVPVMWRFMGYPIKIAAATSQFIMMLSSCAATVTHLAMGSLHGRMQLTLCVSAGAVAGAQLGAALSGRCRSRWVARGFAAALVLTGARMIGRALCAG